MVQLDDCSLEVGISSVLEAFDEQVIEIQAYLPLLDVSFDVLAREKTKDDVSCLHFRFFHILIINRVLFI